MSEPGASTFKAICIEAGKMWLSYLRLGYRMKSSKQLQIRMFGAMAKKCRLVAAVLDPWGWLCGSVFFLCNGVLHPPLTTPTLKPMPIKGNLTLSLGTSAHAMSSYPTSSGQAAPRVRGHAPCLPLPGIVEDSEGIPRPQGSPHPGMP